MTVTRRTSLALAACAAATVLLPTFVGVLAAVVVLAIAVGDAWVVRFPPAVRRDLPSHLSRGVPSTITVTADDPGTRLRQAVASPDLRLEPAEGVGNLRAAIIADRRGEHVLAPVTTRRNGPLGFGAWIHTVGEAHAITVYPDMPAAARIATQVRLGLFREEGRRSRGPLGLGTELETIREYQPDDDIRQVNWRATARTGAPMSNTYRVEQDRDVICLIDCGRLMASPIATADGTVLTRLDAAVDATAAIAAVADEMGDRVGVTAFADRPIVSVAPRRDGGRIVADAIHALETVGVDADYESALAVIAGRKRAFVLVLTDLLDPSAARPLLDALPTVTRSHEVTVASVSDPDVVEALAAPPDDQTTLARAVVAAAVVNRRTETEAELRHRGVDVVVAPVTALSTRCVGAYLRAKSSARI